MKFLKRVELSPDHRKLTVRGVSLSQEPYEIEITDSRCAVLWSFALNSFMYQRRCMGNYKDHENVGYD